MARAIDWAITASTDADHFVAVNVGSDEWNYQVRDLANAVAEMVPGTKVSINTEAPPDKRSYKVDFSLFRRLAPNHVPQTSLRDSVLRLRDGLTAINFSDKNFRDLSLIRLKVLGGLLESGRLDGELQPV